MRHQVFAGPQSWAGFSKNRSGFVQRERSQYLASFRLSKLAGCTILGCVNLGDPSVVIRVAKDGGEWEDPPYTEVEEEKFYRRFGQGVIRVMHGSRTIVPQPSRPPKNDPQNDSPESQTPTPAK
jgi:hypothetical protein